MNRFRNNTAIAAVVLCLLVAGLGVGVPIIGAATGQEAPESILPPGFSQPAPAPSAGPAARRSAPNSLASVDPAAPVAGEQPAAPGVGAGGEDGSGDAALADETAGALPPTPVDPAALAEYELPGFARRSLDKVGVVGPDQGGLGADAFGRMDGRFLQKLMRSLNAPIASRWVSIGLRQALASQVSTPAHVNGADFAAERAWLLLRMGEAPVARALVEAVDGDKYTSKMLQVAMQAALAAGDPAAICPVVDAGRAALAEHAWILAQAMCAGLAGYPQDAGAKIDLARRNGTARGIDLLLAEKVAGAGSSGRRAVTVEWDSVDRLSIWRYGLATATGTEIPEALFDTAAPQARYWQAQAAIWPAHMRTASAERAAAQGVFSNAALVGLYSEVAGDDAAEAVLAMDTARALRSAYTDPSSAGRIGAMAQLWSEAATANGRYARLILTARAAARIPPADKLAEADQLIASMLSAGLDGRAARWAGHVERGGDGWAMLLLASRNDRTRLAKSAVSAYRAAASEAKARMFFAGLAGLGRLDLAAVEQLGESMKVQIDVENSWTRALDRAVAQRAPGAVMLLCAVGMQTNDWRGIPPEALYRITSAMRRVGLVAQARLVAVEALTRL